MVVHASENVSHKRIDVERNPNMIETLIFYSDMYNGNLT